MTTDEKVRRYSDGVGVVEPTGEYADNEIVQATEESLAPIEGRAVVCMDDRDPVEPQPVREKLAGGNLTTGYVAARLSRWELFTREQQSASPDVQVNAVADFLVQADEELGAHTDNHATEENSNCGAADGVPQGISIMARHGFDEFFLRQMRDALGDNFDQSVWNEIVENAQEDAQDSGFDEWSGMTIIKAVRERGGVVEVLNGDNTKPEIDPSNARHNHWGQAVKINSKEGYSNNRQSAIKYFEVDVAPLKRIPEKMATDEHEFKLLLHAAAGYQFAVKHKITKNQPVIY